MPDDGGDGNAQEAPEDEAGDCVKLMNFPHDLPVADTTAFLESHGVLVLNEGIHLTGGRGYNLVANITKYLRDQNCTVDEAKTLLQQLVNADMDELVKEGGIEVEDYKRKATSTENKTQCNTVNLQVFAYNKAQGTEELVPAILPRGAIEIVKKYCAKKMEQNGYANFELLTPDQTKRKRVPKADLRIAHIFIILESAEEAHRLAGTKGQCLFDASKVNINSEVDGYLFGVHLTNLPKYAQKKREEWLTEGNSVAKTLREHAIVWDNGLLDLTINKIPQCGKYLQYKVVEILRSVIERNHMRTPRGEPVRPLCIDLRRCDKIKPRGLQLLEDTLSALPDEERDAIEILLNGDLLGCIEDQIGADNLRSIARRSEDWSDHFCQLDQYERGEIRQDLVEPDTILEELFRGPPERLVAKLRERDVRTNRTLAEAVVAAKASFPQAAARSIAARLREVAAALEPTQEEGADDARADLEGQAAVLAEAADEFPEDLPQSDQSLEIRQPTIANLWTILFTSHEVDDTSLTEARREELAGELLKLTKEDTYKNRRNRADERSTLRSQQNTEVKPFLKWFNIPSSIPEKEIIRIGESMGLKLADYGFHPCGRNGSNAVLCRASSTAPLRDIKEELRKEIAKSEFYMNGKYVRERMEVGQVKAWVSKDMTKRQRSTLVLVQQVLLKGTEPAPARLFVPSLNAKTKAMIVDKVLEVFPHYVPEQDFWIYDDKNPGRADENSDDDECVDNPECPLSMKLRSYNFYVRFKSAEDANAAVDATNAQRLFDAFLWPSDAEKTDSPAFAFFSAQKVVRHRAEGEPEDSTTSTSATATGSGSGSGGDQAKGQQQQQPAAAFMPPPQPPVLQQQQQQFSTTSSSYQTATADSTVSTVYHSARTEESKVGVCLFALSDLMQARFAAVSEKDQDDRLKLCCSVYKALSSGQGRERAHVLLLLMELARQNKSFVVRLSPERYNETTSILRVGELVREAHPDSYEACFELADARRLRKLPHDAKKRDAILQQLEADGCERVQKVLDAGCAAEQLRLAEYVMAWCRRDGGRAFPVRLCVRKLCSAALLKVEEPQSGLSWPLSSSSAPRPRDEEGHQALRSSAFLALALAYKGTTCERQKCCSSAGDCCDKVRELLVAAVQVGRGHARPKAFNLLCEAYEWDEEKEQDEPVVAYRMVPENPHTVALPMSEAFRRCSDAAGRNDNAIMSGLTEFAKGTE